MEVLIEGCETCDRTLAALDASTEQVWIKTALSNVVLLGQAFAVEFECEMDANTFADRVRHLGFKCRVWDGPLSSQRVEAKPSG